MWALHRGRFYVFRDAPMWFITEVASVPMGGEEDAMLTMYVEEAGRELVRRFETSAKNGMPLRTEE
jgi:hypothetical protein